MGAGSGAQAAITTFATFSESFGAPDFIFTNNSPTNATFTATSPIDFRYLNIVGLPADLKPVQNACIDISMTTTQPAVSGGGSPAPLSQGFPVAATTITVTRVDPASLPSCVPLPAAEGNGSRTILLQVTSTATLSGLSGSTSGNLNAATSSGQTVNFSSDFLNFSNTIARDLAIALTQITPLLGLSGPSGAPGTFLNSFSAVGAGSFSSDPVPLVTTPFIAKSFSPSPIPVNGTSTLTFTLANNNGTTANNVSFTDTYPAGVVNAASPNVVNTCGGSPTGGVAGGNTIGLSGVTLNPNTSCTLSVVVTATSSGCFVNTSGTITSTGGDGNTATATLCAGSAPTVTKLFSPNPILPGGTSTLSVTITNPNATQITGVKFTDAYPAGLVNASPTGLTNTCAPGAASAAAGGTSLALAGVGATLAAGASCTVSVNVLAAASGSYPNSTGPVISNQTGPGGPATATLVVGFSSTKSFSPNAIVPNATSVLTITLNNPTASGITGVFFTDTYPGGLVNTATPTAATTCGPGSATAAANGNSVSLTGGVIGAGSSCTITVNVTSATPASYLNSTGPIHSDQGDGAGSTGTLIVLAPLNAAKTFLQNPINKNGTSALQITLTNPNAAAVTNASFTDNYPANLLNAGVPNAATTCAGGTVGATPGTGTLTLSGATVPASGSCTVTVTVTSSVAGSYVNNTGTITSSAGTTPGVSGTLMVLQEPAVAKSFTPIDIPVNGTSVLTVSITNPNSVAMTGVSFTDTYPGNVFNTASPNGSASNCGVNAVVTVLPGDSSVSLGVGAIGPGATCRVSVNVTSSVGGAYVNHTGTVNSSAGIGADAVATLNVLNAFTASKSFNPTAILAGAPSLLTITLNNPNATPVSGVAFTDTYPAGLVNTASPGAATSCGGTLTALANGNSVALVGGTIPASGSCTVSINVTSNSGGSYPNSTGTITSANDGNAGPASATLTVSAPPGVAKAFTPTSILVGGSSLLTVTLSNPNATAINGVAFTDTYPANVVNTGTPGAASTCGGTVTAAANGGSLTLSGGSIAAGGSCQVSVNVTSNTAGSYLNSTGTVTTTNAGNAAAATATLTVSNNPITVAKSFTPSAITAGGTSLLTITLTNPNAGAVTGVTLTDNYPGGVLNTAAPNGLTTCGGGSVTAAANGSSVALSAGTIAGNGSCTVTVNVTGNVAGSYVNSTGSVSTGNAGTAPAATATLTINNIAASVSKSFTPTQVVVNAPSLLTITLTNPNPGSITGVTFTDSYPANLTNTATPGAATTCGGTVTAAANGGALALSGGTIPASGSCTVTVNVQSAVAGSYLNSTGTITASNAPSFGPATASLSVLAAPTVTKAFAPTPVLTNAASVLTITLTNPNASPISGVAFTDTYPANLTNTATPGGATTCGGAVTAAASGTSAALAGGTIPATGSCTVSVNVTSAVGGVYVNNTGTITTAAGAVPGAQGTLTVLAVPTVTKAFAPATIAAGAASVLTITLVNPNATTAVTGVAFTDTYPVNVVNTATPAAASTCGGTVTAVANGPSLVLSGGTIAAGGSCQVSVNVTSNTAGSYLNSTGTVTTTNAGSFGPASATLTVSNGGISAIKTFSPSIVPSGGTSLLTIVLSNPNPGPVTGVAFTDTYPGLLVNTAAPAVATTCGGTVTAAANGGSLTLAGGTISAGGSCQVSVNVTSSTAGSYLNSTGTITTANAGTVAPVTATLVVVNVPTVVKTFAPSTVSAGAPSLLTITFSNPNATTAITGVAFTDAYPPNLINAAVPNAVTSCGGTVTGVPGGASVALSDGTIPPGGNCTVTISVTSNTPGAYVNSTGIITSSNAGTFGPAVANLNVNNAVFTLAKAFGSSTISPGAPTVLTITLTNPSASPAPGAAFVDSYPAGLVNAPNAAPSTTCGGTVTGANNGNSVGLSGGTIPANGSCVVTIAVTAFSPGAYVNSIGSASAQLFVVGGASPTAIPTLSQWMLLFLGLVVAITGALGRQHTRRP